MLQLLRNNPVTSKLIVRYDQMPQRDRQAINLLAIAVFLFLLYFLIWRPASEFHNSAVQSRENAAELVSWMNANRSALKTVSGNSGSSSSSANKPADGRALMALVTRSAGEAGLSLQRFEPSGEDGMRVWLENVPFASVASWLERINQQNGITIDQASMDKQKDPGMVSVRLSLKI